MSDTRFVHGISSEVNEYDMISISSSSSCLRWLPRGGQRAQQDQKKLQECEDRLAKQTPRIVLYLYQYFSVLYCIVAYCIGCIVPRVPGVLYCITNTSLLLLRPERIIKTVRGLNDNRRNRVYAAETKTRRDARLCLKKNKNISHLLEQSAVISTSNFQNIPTASTAPKELEAQPETKSKI